MLFGIAYGQIPINDPLWKADTSRHIPNGSTTITVSGITFAEMCNAVLDAGLTIDRKDNDLQTLSTTFSKKEVWEPVIFIRVKDNIAVLRSEIYSDFLGFQNSYYKEKRNRRVVQNAYMNGFMTIYKIAKSLNKQMVYSTDNNTVTFSLK